VVVRPDLGANFNTNVSTYVVFISVQKRWKKQAIFIPRQNASYTHLVNNIVYSNEAAKTI